MDGFGKAQGTRYKEGPRFKMQSQ